METFPLSKVEKIYQFWVEITLPEEEREKRMREKADAAAERAREQLFNVKIEEEFKNPHEQEIFKKFLEINKRR
jgi:hypothetical protein